MTVGHLLFAAVLTGYMMLAAVFEERDLVAHFGRQYAEYRRRVPMFVPRLRRRSRCRRIAGAGGLITLVRLPARCRSILSTSSSVTSLASNSSNSVDCGRWITTDVHSS